jgi:methylmalonyl-CoA/ethylmalonyl-CoA epimerase
VKILRISHLGLAVRSLQEAGKFYSETLHLPDRGREIIAEQKVIVSMHPLGDGRIELLEPTHPDSTVAKFLAKRGEGLHHICFEVADISEALAELKANGIRLIDETPRVGAGGCKIAFLHPESTHGLLIELSEEPQK